MREGFKRRGGFTLIELMITVAIIAILSAIALPSYLDYVRKGKRADARALLQAAAITQEKYRLSNPTYANTTGALSPPCPTSGTCTSEQGNYTLATPTGVTATGYTLTANAASGSQLADTGCTAITYAVSGGSITYGPSNTCWGK
jgi:type IV pilus assembly protein PilE